MRNVSSGSAWHEQTTHFIMIGLQTPSSSFCLASYSSFSAVWLASSQADVFAPDLQAFPLLERALPLALHADLGPGDALYLPCGWWHAVQSRPPAGQRSISLSYWARQPGGKIRDSLEGGAGFHV